MNTITDMEQVARDHGYTFWKKGCPCSGLPLIYRKASPEGNLELWLYPARNMWRLQRNYYIIDKGTDNVMNTQLQQWD